MDNTTPASHLPAQIAQWHQLLANHQRRQRQTDELEAVALQHDKLLDLYPAFDQALAALIEGPAQSPDSALPDPKALAQTLQQLASLEELRVQTLALVNKLKDLHHLPGCDELCQQTLEASDKALAEATPLTLESHSQTLQDLLSRLEKVEKDYQKKAEDSGQELERLKEVVDAMRHFCDRHGCHKVAADCSRDLQSLPADTSDPQSLEVLRHCDQRINEVMQSFFAEEEPMREQLARARKKQYNKSRQQFLRSIWGLRGISTKREERWRKIADEMEAILEQGVALSDRTADHFRLRINRQTAWGVVLTLLTTAVVAAVVAALLYAAVAIVLTLLTLLALWLGFSLAGGASKKKT